MLIRKKIISISALVFSVAVAAPARSESFYFQIDGGAAFQGETEVDGGTEFDYDIGFVAGGRIGGRVSDLIRLEVDVAYAENEIDDVDGIAFSALGLDADVQVLTFGVGAYADLIRLDALTPYAGAGIGGAYKEIDTNFGGDDEATDLAAHGELGIALAITPQIAVVPHYRLVWFDEYGDDEQFAHWLRLGVRFGW